MAPRVLISDELSTAAVQIFKDRGVEVDYQPKLGKDKDALLAIIGNYDGLAIRSATKATEKLISAAANLKVIGRAGIGVDNVDIPAASKKGVIVMNTPFGNSITTAEHAIAMMLAVARQIAEALEAAHGQGIVHRDLKPANVKVRDDGTVKVLDFGLAKASSPGKTAPADVSQSPTIVHPGTAVGMILGTAAYMSPEQAAGKLVDRRTDIWAFGVVLWEMLSGRRLFDAESVPETLGAVFRQEIDFDALPATTPAAVRELVMRCLERDPKARLRDIGEARIALQTALQSSAG